VGLGAGYGWPWHTKGRILARMAVWRVALAGLGQR